MLLLFLLVFGLFFRNVKNTKHHILFKTAHAIALCVLQMQMQYKASAVDKMKIEPVMISFIENTTSSKMADQNDDIIAKESS